MSNVRGTLLCKTKLIMGLSANVCSGQSFLYFIQLAERYNFHMTQHFQFLEKYLFCAKVRKNLKEIYAVQGCPLFPFISSATESTQQSLESCDQFMTSCTDRVTYG